MFINGKQNSKLKVIKIIYIHFIEPLALFAYQYELFVCLLPRLLLDHTMVNFSIYELAPVFQ
ncbi:hypothetical protein SOHN41_00347 [Shewanella sp. HN-41]|nr:hypothetical protein SOHN41_00347 [Shewanella sp. HN-41]